MQIRTSRHYARRTAAAIGGLAIIATACSGDSTGLGNNSKAQLGFVAAGAASATASTAPITVGSHTLDLTSVSLTISRAELKRAGTDACADDDDSGDDHSNGSSSAGCGELKVGPTTINLPLTGNIVTVPANTIPAGTYRELELRVSQVEVKGTFDGKTFDDTLNVNAQSEIQFATPLVVSDTGATSITVSVPTASWFVNNDGSLIDPGSLRTSTSLSAFVQNRIRASFRAFEDRDHDGRDDHGGDRGSDR